MFSRSRMLIATALGWLMLCGASESREICIDKSGKRLSCEAVSANAAADQAQDACWQIIVGVLTFGVAVAAASFAAIAAKHTKRAADAAHLANRPWIDIKLTGVFDLRKDGDNIRCNVEIEVRNYGNSPAIDLDPKAFLCIQDSKFPDFGHPLLRGLGSVVFPDREPMKLELSAMLPADQNIEQKAQATGTQYLRIFLEGKYSFKNGSGHTLRAYDLVGDGTLSAFRVDNLPKSVDQFNCSNAFNITE